MRETQVFNVRVDVAGQKEVVLKQCIQPCLDEAFVASTNIEEKLAHMQVVYERGQTPKMDSSVVHVQRVQ